MSDSFDVAAGNVRDTHAREASGEVRIVAADMGAALRELSDQLGPDALLLSSRSVAEGVEILALPPGAVVSEGKVQPSNEARSPLQASPSVDVDVPRNARSGGQSSPDNPAISAAASRLAESIGAMASADSSHSSSDSGSFAQLHSELQQVRAMLEQRIAYSGDESSAVLPNPQQYTLLNRLHKLGLSMPEARAILERVDDRAPVAEAWRQCVRAYAEALPLAGDDPLQTGGVVVVGGPAGAGKTAVLMKLALRYLAHHRSSEVAIICADTYASSNRTALEKFASLARVVFHGVDNQNPLSQRVAESARCSLVLVDTSAHDPIASIDGRAIKQLLVLPAYADVDWLKYMSDRYYSSSCIGAVLTHLDSAASASRALAQLQRQKMPLLYISTGPLMPDCLQRVDVSQLVRLLEPEVTRRELSADFDDLAFVRPELGAESIAVGV